jgi:DNA repair protein RecO (recombination protein O)
VSREAAEPYLDRLLKLPAFLSDEVPPEAGDLADAFRLSGHFLALHVWGPRDIAPPPTRETLVALLSEI